MLFQIVEMFDDQTDSIDEIRLTNNNSSFLDNSTNNNVIDNNSIFYSNNNNNTLEIAANSIFVDKTLDLV